MLSNVRRTRRLPRSAGPAAAIIVLGVVLVLGAQPLCAQQTQVMVTVVDEKTGEPVGDLRASNFSVVDGKTPLRVESAEYEESRLDVMLVVDVSAIGENVRPLAEAVIDGLGEQDQMGIVAYHGSADLIQDFTSSKKLLFDSLRKIRYGGEPRVLDALYATLDGGFDGTGAGRRVVLLVTAGVTAGSRSTSAEVLALARRRRVSIFPVYARAFERRLFRRLARSTAGADFDARRLKLKPSELSELVYSAVRGRYLLELSGVYTLGDRIEITLQGLPKSKRKLRASVLALD